MMNNLYRFFTGSLILLLVQCTPEGDLKPTDVDTYIKFKGDSQLELTAVDAALHPDGGVILLANATNSSGETVPRLLKIDNNGTTEWSHDINIQQVSYSLQLVTGDDFVIAGEIRDAQNNLDLSVIRVSSSGSISNSYSKTEAIRARGVELNDDGSFFITGEAPGTDDGPWTTIRPVMVHLSSTFQELSYVRISGEKNFITNQAYGRTENTDQYVYWAANDPNSNKSEITKAKIGENVSSSPTYPNMDMDFEIKSFAPFSMPYFGMIGNTNGSTYYAYANADNLSAANAFVELKTNTEAESIAVHSNGNFLIGGTFSGNGNDDFVLMIVDVNGNKQIEDKVYGGDNADVLKKVLGLPDGSIILYGHTEFGDVNTLLILKTDTYGEL